MHRDLQQKEPVEAAWIDRNRPAIADIIDRDTVEIRAVVTRVKVTRRTAERIETMRTKNAANLVGCFIDVGRENAAERGKPLARSRCRLCLT